MSETKETMDTFQGWENASDVEFFGEAPEDTNDVDKIIDTVEKTDVNDETETTDDDVQGKKEDEKKDDAEDINFFDGDSSEEENDNNADEDDNAGSSSANDSTSTTEGLSKKAMVEYLKDKGLVDFELEEDAELTDELAEEILEDSFDDGIESRVGELMKDLPDTVKNIVNLAINGGNVDKFISSLTTTPTIKITEDLDMEDEANQELVMRTIRQGEGDDNETIDTYIDFLKDSGKLKSVSEKSKEKIVATNKQLVEQQAKQAKKAKEDAKIKQRAFKNELSSYIDGLENISSLTVNKADKRTLPSYIADRDVTLQDGRKTTALQKDLLEALQDKEKTVLLAKLLKSDFDFSEIAKGEQTKYTKKVKEGLSRSKKANTTNTGSSQKRGSLADYF